MTLILMSCSTTQVQSDSFCIVSKDIPFDRELFREACKSYPKLEPTFRGVINHNDVREGICNERTTDN